MMYKFEKNRPLNMCLKFLFSFGGVAFLCLILSLVGLGIVYQRIGRTPEELLDYAERRLEGHTRLEFIVLPVFNGLRILLDAPSIKQRQKVTFEVPKPPRRINFETEYDEIPKISKVIRVGPYEAIKTITEAAKIALDGNVVEIEGGEYKGDVVVWKQNKLTIRGISGHARLFADGKSAEGKAIWVIRNGEFKVENIDFIGAKVFDKNGAGIRFERGNLLVRNCLFYNNQNGILTTADGQSQLQIENSEFAYNGAGDGQSHNLYVGAMASLKVTGSYFHHADTGHLLKSRAKHNYIAYNRLTDEAGGRASYELDFPNGGIVEMIGNIVEQSRTPENSALIAIGEEGYSWSKNRIYLFNNTIVNDHPYGGTFLRVAMGAEIIVSKNNLLIGKGGYQTVDLLISDNDIKATKDIFIDAANYNYELNAKGKDISRLPKINTQANADDLNFKRQYYHPMSNKVLKQAAVYAGAQQ